MNAQEALELSNKSKAEVALRVQTKLDLYLRANLEQIKVQALKGFTSCPIELYVPGENLLDKSEIEERILLSLLKESLQALGYMVAHAGGTSWAHYKIHWHRSVIKLSQEG